MSDHQHADQSDKMKMYVGNLPFQTTNEELEELFGAHGTVTDVHMPTDRESGRSRSDHSQCSVGGHLGAGGVSRQGDTQLDQPSAHLATAAFEA